eukprot:350942-Chlamydomonas_euryale.AAC.3
MQQGPPQLPSVCDAAARHRLGLDSRHTCIGLSFALANPRPVLDTNMSGTLSVPVTQSEAPQGGGLPTGCRCLVVESTALEFANKLHRSPQPRCPGAKDWYQVTKTLPGEGVGSGRLQLSSQPTITLSITNITLVTLGAARCSARDTQGHAPFCNEG